MDASLFVPWSSSVGGVLSSASALVLCTSVLGPGGDSGYAPGKEVHGLEGAVDASLMSIVTSARKLEVDEGILEGESGEGMRRRWSCSSESYSAARSFGNNIERI